MTSLWMLGAKQTTTPLVEDIDADVAVVGAGYTGLSCALALRAAGLSVVVLERDIAGAGASGRNCGQVGAEIGKNLPTLERFLGIERAREAASFLKSAITHLESLIRDHEIDCAYQPRGNVYGGVHPDQERFFERAARSAEKLGIPVQVLSDEELRSRGIPQSIACGYQEGIGGDLHPGRYVLGLRRAAISSGAMLFERSPVLAVHEGKTIRLQTDQATVRARYCVLATNAYTPELGWLGRKLLPACVSSVVTDRLTQAQQERLGWKGREPIYTAHHLLENLRWTDDGRILIGTKRVDVGLGDRRLRPTRELERFDALEKVLRSRLPEISDVAVHRGWSGHVALTIDFLPVIGRTGRMGNILYAGGYSGHGISLASAAGRVLSDIILERDLGPARVLVERRLPPLPPGPLGIGAARGFVRTLTWLDDRLDRRAVAFNETAPRLQGN